VPPSRGRLAFLTVWTTLAGIGALITFLFLGANLLGANTTATVDRVYTREGYGVTFTTDDGTPCETVQKWGPGPAPVETGDTLEVRYSRISPCDNVHRVDDWFALYGFPAIPTVMVVGGLIGIRRMRRNP
jgi:hypothetical protein